MYTLCRVGTQTTCLVNDVKRGRLVAHVEECEEKAETTTNKKTGRHMPVGFGEGPGF